LTTSGRKAAAKKRTHSEGDSSEDETNPSQHTAENSDKPGASDQKKIKTSQPAGQENNPQSALPPSDDEQPSTSGVRGRPGSPEPSALTLFSPGAPFDIDYMIMALEELAEKELQSQQDSQETSKVEVDGVPFLSAGYKAITALLDYYRERKALDKGQGIECNPLMVDSPISGEPSPHTVNYLISRLHKDRNIATAGAGAMVLKEFIRFNLADSYSVARRTAATTSRLLCLKNLMTALEASRHSAVTEHAKTIRDWKEVKLGTAVWDGLGVAFDINDEQAFARRIIYFHEHTPAIEQAAQELHCMANAELAMLQRAPAGLRVEMPAMKLLEAMFIELSQLTFMPNLVVTAGREENLTPKQQLVRNLAQEPAGWVAIFDKLKLK